MKLKLQIFWGWVIGIIIALEVIALMARGAEDIMENGLVDSITGCILIFGTIGGLSLFFI